MTDSRGQHVTRSRKKAAVPLSKLRTAEVMRAVVDHPRRLAELVGMLDDRDRLVRGRAAATLARLSETHAGRLVRILERLKEGLTDDAAYVRWSLAYALGRVGGDLPVHSQCFMNELMERLEDDNRVVRLLACRALGRIAARRPQQIRELFVNGKREMPASIERIVRGRQGDTSKTARRS